MKSRNIMFHGAHNFYLQNVRDFIPLVLTNGIYVLYDLKENSKII